MKRKVTKWFKRPLAILMALMMTISLMPSSGLAISTAAGENVLANADFGNGMDGWSTYVGSDWAGANAVFTPVENGVQIDMAAVGNSEWGIQLAQKEIPFEVGKSYEVSFDVVSTMAKRVNVYLQNKYGEADSDVTDLINTGITLAAGEPQHFSAVSSELGSDMVKMNLTFGLGGMAGDGASGTLTITNLCVKEAESEDVGGDSVVTEGNLLTDPQFNQVGDVWQTYVGTDWSGATADFAQAAEGVLDVDITNVGSGNEWSIQLHQDGIALAADIEYILSFETYSTGNKQIKVFLQADGDRIAETLQLKAGEAQQFSFTSTPLSADMAANLFFALGTVSPEDEATKISFSKICLTPVKKVQLGENILKDTEFADVAADGNGTTWQYYLSSNDGGWAGETASVSGDGAGKLNLNISSVGGGFADAKWGIQIYQTGVALKAGTEYVLSFDTTSTGNKKIEAKFDAYDQLLDEVIQLNAGENQSFSFTIPAADADAAVKFLFAAGWFDGDEPSDITISNISLCPIKTGEDVKVKEIALSADNKTVTFQKAYNESYPGAPIVQFGVFNSQEEAEAATEGFAGYPMERNEDGVWETSVELDAALEAGQVIKYFFIEFDKDGAGYNSDYGYYSLFIPEDYNGDTGVYDGWTMIWNDEFDGTELDTTKWSYQIGTGAEYGLDGWGNSEEQYYTDSEENVRVEDGKLIIQAKEEKVGNKSYTSGRIRTVSDDEVLFSTTYGRIEAKMKLPTGNGVWPAFWMLPVEPEIYQGWAASGELDIMEARGRLPGEVGGTIHYGSQWPNNVYTGKPYYFDESVTNINAYHLYSVEWEPGEIRFYVDNELYYTANNWYSRGANTAADYTYPAPFDKDFYILLNLAIGGTFDGGIRPDSSDMPATMEVDYVRVYSKDEGYDEDVEKTDVGKDKAAFEEYAAQADAEGNYITDAGFTTLNGDPIVDGGVDPSNKNWQLAAQTDFNGAATASVDTIDGADYAKVNITAGGNQSYAVQLIQHLPLASGYTYKVSFDAKASDVRNIVIHPSGDADNGWAGYGSETITLSKEMQHYEYEFTMSASSDPTARLEFNLGLATGDVWIGNVSVVETAPSSVDEDASKAPLGNGNQIYNGTFDQGGIDRMIFWHTNEEADFSVDRDSRKLLVQNINEGSTGVFWQQGIQLLQSDQYKLEMDVCAAEDTSFMVVFGEKGDEPEMIYALEEFNVSAGATEHISYTFAMPKDITDMNGSFYVCVLQGGVATFDNISLVRQTNNNVTIDYSNVNLNPVTEDSNAWLQCYNQAGNEPIANEDGVITIEAIPSSMNNYQVMLLHELELTEGVQYVLNFDIKSDIADTYAFSIQQDNTWAVSLEDLDLSTTTEWQHKEYTFTAGFSTGANPIYLKYLLSGCESQGNVYVKDVSLKAVVEEAALDAPEGAVTVEGDAVSGKELVLKFDGSEWSRAFLNAAANGGNAVIMFAATAINNDDGALADMIDLEAGTVTVPNWYTFTGETEESVICEVQFALEGYNNLVLSVEIGPGEEVDRSGLEAALEAAMEVDGEEEDYTEESLNAFMDAVSHAIVVYFDMLATQEEVDAAAEAVLTAIAGLEKVTPNPSEDPSEDPSVDPSEDPSVDPSKDPSVDPSKDPSEDPTQPASPTTPTTGSGNSANTGDSNAVAIWIMMLLLSGICGCVLIFRKKENR